MKKLMLFILSIVMVSVLNAQTVFNINESGFTFVPSDVTVNQGDIVRFNGTSFHPVREVSQATWNANGRTQLAGGFSFPSGTGDYTAGTPGTHYYVCTAHVVSFGMKGTITVNAITGLNDIQDNNGGKVFPNPATDFIIYQTGRNSSINEIRILDMYGKAVIILQEPVFSNEQVRIDIENLNKGIYFILVKSDDGTVSKKFLKS
jgi:plastocyanin